MNRGNTLVYTLLGLTVAAIVGLCFAPLIYRPCGHRGSLVDRWFPRWNPHHCAGVELRADLLYIDAIISRYRIEYGRLENNLFDMVPEKFGRDTRYKFAYTRNAENWQIRVAKTKDIPGWYLFNNNGKVYFNKRGPVTLQDPVLPDFGTP